MWLVSSFVPRPPLLTRRAPSTHRVWARLIQSERFGREGERYNGDAACVLIVYRRCCCPQNCGDYGIWKYGTFLSYFAIPHRCCHMFGPNSVACCFSALFIILAGFAAVATVCDPTWRSVDQTLSRCLIGCCRWPVALCLVRFEENCVNNLSSNSINIHIYSAIAPASAAHQYIIQIMHGSWLTYNTFTLAATYLM